MQIDVLIGDLLLLHQINKPQTMIDFLIKLVFGWLPVKDYNIKKLTNYIYFYLEERGIQESCMPSYKTRVSLLKEAFERAKNKNGKVLYIRYLKQLDRVCNESYKCLRGQNIIDDRVKEIIRNC